MNMIGELIERLTGIVSRKRRRPSFTRGGSDTAPGGGWKRPLRIMIGLLVTGSMMAGCGVAAFAANPSSGKPAGEPAPSTSIQETSSRTGGEGRRASLTIRAVASTTLTGVGVELYRVGDYAVAGDVGSMPFESLRIVSHGERQRRAATEVLSGIGKRTSGDPMNDLWHMTDIGDRERAYSSLAERIRRSGMSADAVATGEGDVSVPEGVYLVVPHHGMSVATLAGTAIDGLSPNDHHLGMAMVCGEAASDPAELTATGGDGTASVANETGNGSPAGEEGLFSRLRGMFSLRSTRAAALSLKEIGRIPWNGDDFAAGDFILSNGRHALCVQAAAHTPELGTGYDPRSYNFGTDKSNRMRSVFYFGPEGPGNIFGSDRNTGLVMVHYALSAIHNGSTAGIPGSVLKDGFYNKLISLSKSNPIPDSSGLRLLFYMAQPASAGQSLIGWEMSPWKPGIITHAGYASAGSFLSGKPQWKDSVNAKIARNSVLRDVVSIKALGVGHPTDDFFTIDVRLNIDANKDGRAEKSIARRRIVNDYFTRHQTRDYTFQFLTGSQGGGATQWPANADLWYDTIVRRVSPSDPGYAATVYEYRSYMVPNGAQGQRYVHYGFNQSSGANDPAERYNTEPIPPPRQPDSREMTATVTSQAVNGLVQGWNQNDITAATRFSSHGASLRTAGGSAPLVDEVALTVSAADGHHDWDADGDGHFDADLRFVVKTTLHLEGGKTASKLIPFKGYRTSSNANGTGTESFSFVPDDVGLDEWPTGDAWFTSAVVSVTGASNPAGYECPAGQMLVNAVAGSHRLCLKDYGRQTSELNGAESVHLIDPVTPRIASNIATASKTDGTLPKDAITVTLPKSVTGLTVLARADVYWSPTKGSDGTAIPKDAKRIGTVTPLKFPATGFRDGKQTILYDPTVDAAMKSTTHIGTGYVTYVWRIDAADLAGQRVTYSWNFRGRGWAKTLTIASERILDMGSSVTDGWRPGREQAEQLARWRLSVTKIARMGNGSQGAWMADHPAAGAVLHMRETSDANGTTMLNEAPTSTITLDAQGRGTFAEQHIRSGQTRYYRVWESKAPEPMRVPANNAYWMVKVTNVTGSRGVTLNVTGSSDETSWLIKGVAAGTAEQTTSPGSGRGARPEHWRQTLGDPVGVNVSPPITGSDVDAVRMMIGVLVVTAGIAGLGFAVVRFRR